MDIKGKFACECGTEYVIEFEEEWERKNFVCDECGKEYKLSVRVDFYIFEEESKNKTTKNH